MEIPEETCRRTESGHIELEGWGRGYILSFRIDSNYMTLIKDVP